MDSSPRTTPQRPRLNPFAFPSDTDFRFVLLIVSVLGASLFIYGAVYFSIPSNYAYYADTLLKCWQIQPELPSTIEGFADPEAGAAQVAYRECMVPAERSSAAWRLSGVFLLLIVASLIYWTYPARKIRSDKLVPLSDDAPEVSDYLDKLSHAAQLSHPPTFLWNPLNPASGGLAFGRLGRYYISLTGGLVIQFYKDQPAFRAVVLHELAHLRNADIDKTYFAVAVWQAFLIAALFPFLISLFGNEWDYVLAVLWRVIALAVLVYLMRNAVLRTRELYADVRASTWDGPTGALSRVLGSLPSPKISRWRLGLQMHPDTSIRRQVLEDSGRLFPMGFWDAFATGMAAGVALPSLMSLMAALRTGTSSLILESLVGVLTVVPLVAGVVGLGIWRTRFAALARGDTPHGTGHLSLGLGFGILLGLILSFNATITLQETGVLAVWAVLFDIAWGLLLLVGLFFLLGWTAAGASAWLDVAAASPSPRPFYVAGLMVAGGVFAVWFAALLFLRSFGTAVVWLLASPLGTLWSIVQNPLTLLALISLWAFPLAAWFARRRAVPASEATWGYLSPSPQGPVRMPQAPFRLGLALVLGLIVGFVYWGVLLLIRIGARLSFPEAVRDTDEFRLAFYLVQVVVAVLMQAGLAAVLAGWVRRLGAVHGLFSAFVAGCIMTVGLLVLNLVFGGTLSPQFVWDTFSQIVNEGALLALPLAWIVAGLAELLRQMRERPRSVSQEQIA